MKYKMRKYYYSICILILIAITIIGCSNSSDKVNETETLVFDENISEFGNVEAPAEFDWRQCEGTILNFICEDNLTSNILTQEFEKFTNTTGIKVNIRKVDPEFLEELINIEFISKTAQYDLIYVDPYKTLNRFYNGLEDLNKYENDNSLPHIVGGIESFSKEHLEISSKFDSKDHLYSIPFDTSSMLLFYRQDIFDKYSIEMKEDLGFEIDHNGEITWEQYIEIGKWIDKHASEVGVDYSSIITSEHSNLMYLVFSAFLDSYGGNYFNNNLVYNIGGRPSHRMLSKYPTFITALEKFKEVVTLSPDGTREYTSDDILDAFIEGQVAMIVHENDCIFEIENSDTIGGKVGYSVLPRGNSKSSNVYGGAGIGINKYASDKQKLASWMFIVWATSPQVQITTFLSSEGSIIPTRTALREYVESEYNDEFPQVISMLKAQTDSYVYYRPKIYDGYEFEKLINSNLIQMINEDLDEKSVAIIIGSQWSENH